ncbi:MAG: 6,7-dimethyl-8-ribityllumazine synthase [Trueperaceae bacterium]
MRVLEGGLDASGLRFAVVVSRFNELVTSRLLDGALSGLRRHGADDTDVTVAWVPGAVEIGVVAQRLARSGEFDAVITLGAVVRGATSHFDYVSSMVAASVARAAEDSGVPVIFGVLTTDTMEQALDRAGGKVGNKGTEAAVTAVEMARLLEQLG